MLANGIPSTMNPEMMLAQLAPLREPAPVDWWPLAAGWWILIALVLLTGCLLGRWYHIRRSRRQYRRMALAELRQLRERSAAADELNRLLKAAALRAYSHETVARLHGQQWLDFLCNTCDTVTVESLRTLEDRYCSKPAVVSPTLFDAAEDWIRNHEVSRA